MKVVGVGATRPLLFGFPNSLLSSSSRMRRRAYRKVTRCSRRSALFVTPWSTSLQTRILRALLSAILRLGAGQ